MGRLNIGGGGKQVEIKSKVIAKVGTSNIPHAVIAAIPDTLNTKRPFGMKNGCAYIRASSKIYKVRISGTSAALENTLDIRLRLTDPYFTVNGNAAEVFLYQDKIIIQGDGNISRSETGTGGVELDLDFNVVRHWHGGPTFRGRGEPYCIDGHVISIYVDSSSKVLLYEYDKNLQDTTFTVKTIAPRPDWAGVANQSVRISDSLIAHRVDGQLYNIIDWQGNIKGSMHLPTNSQYFYLSEDEFEGYDGLGGKYALLYEITPNTNSIPNPKRKNLSAKFDVLPNWM